MNKQQINNKTKTGKVFLVGAGPGSKDLLTLKALEVIQSCDVILFDNLVGQEIRDLFPKGTKKIFVGKKKDLHTLTQEEINALLKRLALKGHSVCRLKGGDPFVFGRGSEEMLVLKQAEVKVEVIPGVSAAIGCGAYAGIPLTHRHVSQGCTFVTGHAAKSLEIDWKSLANLQHTLVFYMGLSQCNVISSQLIQAGLSYNTPCALIEKGTLNEQRTLTTTLADLAQSASQSGFGSPTLIVVGDVVNLHKQLAWFGEDEAAASLEKELDFQTLLPQQLLA